MRVELIDAENNVLTMVDTDSPEAELEFYGPQIGATGWREWQEPPPDPAAVRAAALARIDASTRAAIIGGFVSSASGSPHTYDSDENDQKNLTLMQTVSHSPRFAAHPVYQGRIPVRAVPEGQTEKTTLYLTTEQMDLLVEDLALHIGACKMAGWAAQAEVQ